jgi:hypothetical protein
MAKPPPFIQKKIDAKAEDASASDDPKKSGEDESASDAPLKKGAKPNPLKVWAKKQLA